ncbi:MAG: UDP-3-O-(3-hydroxymyristoyl)glucosamine N-acyltransferase [Phycisphaerales bacterium]|nr:UDP-3-O-(3-hydroxymyristoyl)glucosamine N-acyltransferase [Phycisphaerales bacterium]
MKSVSLADISKFIRQQGIANDIDGDPEIAVSAVNTLEDAQPGEISFLSNPRYHRMLPETRASAVIVTRQTDAPDRLALVRTDDPYAAVAAAIVRVHGYRKHPRWGIDVRTTIAASARIGENANIGPWVSIAVHAEIGDNATIYPGCYIGDHVTIGHHVTLFPNVTIYDRTQIGHRVTIHAGTSIGQDGLGYAPRDGRWIKIPQVGQIIIDDDVEIGAGCAFDRATLGATRIGRGSKFSDLVVIGHGAKIGQDCMVVGQVGIAGSAVIGDHVTLAGQVGVGGHLTIGDGARIGAQSGVVSSLDGGVEYQGSPAVPSPDFRRQSAAIQKLPELVQRIRDLERELTELRQRMDNGERPGR